MNQPRILTDVKESVKNNANVDLAVKSVLGATFVGITIFGLKWVATKTGFRPLREAATVIKGAK